MMKLRYDVAYHENHTTIQEHFCREWDESGGCYGTNPNHGYSYDEACDEVAAWYEEQAKHWRDRTHHDAALSPNQKE